MHETEVFTVFICPDTKDFKTYSNDTKYVTNALRHLEHKYQRKATIGKKKKIKLRNAKRKSSKRKYKKIRKGPKEKNTKRHRSKGKKVKRKKSKLRHQSKGKKVKRKKSKLMKKKGRF